MGIVVKQVTFDAPAPTAAEISSRAAQLLGLQLIVRDTPPEIREPLHDLLAYIAYEAYPNCEVELKAYRAGGVNEHLRLTGMDAIPFAHVVEGANEAAGKQTVFVRDYIGREPTLLIATTLALEALGGTLSEPIPEETRREFGRRISVTELRWRIRKNETIQFLKLAGTVVLLPILLPIVFASIGWKLIVCCARSLLSTQDFEGSRPRDTGVSLKETD